MSIAKDTDTRNGFRMKVLKFVSILIKIQVSDFVRIFVMIVEGGNVLERFCIQLRKLKTLCGFYFISVMQLLILEL